MRYVLVCLALSWLVLAPAAQAADTYTVDSCATEGGAAATTQGWTFDSAGVQTTGCPSPGIVAGEPLGGTIPTGGGWNLRFTPPAGTSIAAYRLWRVVSLRNYWNYTLFSDPSLREEYVVERCWTMAAVGTCSSLGDGHATGTPDVAQSGLDSGGLVLHVDCNPGNCAANGSAYVNVKRLQVDLHDRINPTLSGVSGDLFDTSKPVSGVRAVSFSASDQGGGVYMARLEADGVTVASGVVDDNGGRCAKPFKDLVPCKTTATGLLNLDTSQLVNGVHALRLVVTDATEANSAVYGPIQITTANQSTSCAGGVAAEVTARFASTRRTALTRPGGKALTLTGTAPAGATVLLLSREVRTGAARTVASSAVAGADGKYRLSVPAGRSRTLAVAYRPTPTTPTLRCARELRVRVPARLTFTARRSSALRYRLSGRLRGGEVPHRGKLVELQGYERGKWRTFDTERSSSSGRFSASYRFQSGSAGRRFRLRVRVRTDPSYPYSTGYSHVVHVLVR